LQADNAAKLDQMRRTVDEKLEAGLAEFLELRAVFGYAAAG